MDLFTQYFAILSGLSVVAFIAWKLACWLTVKAVHWLIRR